MPNAALTAALREAYALATSNAVVLDTLQLHHPILGTDLFLVNDRQNHTFTLENAEQHEFVGRAFQLSLPAINADGLPEMSLAIDDVGNQVSSFLKLLLGSQVALEITYRPYFSDTPGAPQMDPPLVMYLRGARKQGPTVQGRATFADLVNKKFPRQRYDRSRFPSLGN